MLQIRSVYTLHGNRHSHLCSHTHTITLSTTLQARSSKLQKILDIWKQGNGVVSLHCFHSALAAEAFTREACMVEAVGKSV